MQRFRALHDVDGISGDRVATQANGRVRSNYRGCLQCTPIGNVSGHSAHHLPRALRTGGARHHIFRIGTAGEIRRTEAIGATIPPHRELSGQHPRNAAIFYQRKCFRLSAKAAGIGAGPCCVDAFLNRPLCRHDDIRIFLIQKVIGITPRNTKRFDVNCKLFAVGIRMPGRPAAEVPDTVECRNPLRSLEQIASQSHGRPK
jgi:hypothetical protein